MLGLPVMVRQRNAGGRPRTLQRRVSRQVSLCGASDDKAREMVNFSAFVRGCLVGRSEGVPEHSRRLAVIIDDRLWSNHYDKELKQWKTEEAEKAHECALALIVALKHL